MTNVVKQLRCNLRDNSIDVRPEWMLIKEFTKQLFDRLPTVKPVNLDNLKECGELFKYDYSWDKATAKKPKALNTHELFERAAKSENKEEAYELEPTIYDDPVMIELIEQNKADIFSTDSIIAAIMCSTSSNYSWDIEIRKFDNKIFIDKRADELDQNILNFNTVCETSLDHQPYDDASINGIKQLMVESKIVSNAWIQQCQNPDVLTKIDLDEENPFREDPEQRVTPQGYIYKIWKLQDANEQEGTKEKRICIRCKVHTHTGKLKENGEKELMNVYSFNEHSIERTNWRSQIDSSLIACLNREIADNSFKAKRWLIESLLSEVDLIKFGFVTRKNMNDASKHIVVGTHTVKTNMWAKEMGVVMEKKWNILRHVIEHIENHEVIKESPEEGKENGDRNG
mmetsp:Transcript_13366/g.22743  ORF Transcript_13366/g.22743 Transcript_13366/m.22743 type:complete len:399 (+) Transcript_13366:616-1812(+)